MHFWFAHIRFHKQVNCLGIYICMHFPPLNAVIEQHKTVQRTNKTAQRTNTRLKTFLFFQFVGHKTVKPNMADYKCRALKEPTDIPALAGWLPSPIGGEPPSSSTLL